MLIEYYSIAILFALGVYAGPIPPRPQRRSPAPHTVSPPSYNIPWNPTDAKAPTEPLLDPIFEEPPDINTPDSKVVVCMLVAGQGDDAQPSKICVTPFPDSPSATTAAAEASQTTPAPVDSRALPLLNPSDGAGAVMSEGRNTKPCSRRASVLGTADTPSSTNIPGVARPTNAPPFPSPTPTAASRKPCNRPSPSRLPIIAISSILPNISPTPINPVQAPDEPAFITTVVQVVTSRAVTSCMLRTAPTAMGTAAASDMQPPISNSTISSPESDGPGTRFPPSPTAPFSSPLVVTTASELLSSPSQTAVPTTTRADIIPISALTAQPSATTAGSDSSSPSVDDDDGGIRVIPVTVSAPIATDSSLPEATSVSGP
ncbi:hypothetical protein AJ80_00828 [Polytolypa hystricis UAMH7299]|uniref:Uncharacterized protein n=1 Tax=Polytolypa hystricis (strain UAMH7299) TaxID=1447883 RepID=A0A2B7Z0X9_POLH7|nr:hypothetical protein AJ80_00828 [Polytolypa hystricis UAMH7299]